MTWALNNEIKLFHTLMLFGARSSPCVRYQAVVEDNSYPRTTWRRNEDAPTSDRDIDFCESTAIAKYSCFGNLFNSILSGVGLFNVRDFCVRIPTDRQTDFFIILECPAIWEVA